MPLETGIATLVQMVKDLNAKLRTSMRRRDRPVTDALRSVLGDLANAEAIVRSDCGSTRLSLARMTPYPSPVRTA